MSYKICVSGSAEGQSEKAMKMAMEVGREIAREGHILVTGATKGVPFAAARGAKKEGGTVVGFSPAGSEKEHLQLYRLPHSKWFDYVVYSKAGYTGRNLLMVRSCDATIVICGRIGTLNEFTCAFEENEIAGVLTGSGGVADEIERILVAANKGRRKVFFEGDPKKIVAEAVSRIGKENERRKRERRLDQLEKEG